MGGHPQHAQHAIPAGSPATTPLAASSSCPPGLHDRWMLKASVCAVAPVHLRVAHHHLRTCSHGPPTSPRCHSSHPSPMQPLPGVPVNTTTRMPVANFSRKALVWWHPAGKAGQEGHAMVARLGRQLQLLFPQRGY